MPSGRRKSDERKKIILAGCSRLHSCSYGVFSYKPWLSSEERAAIKAADQLADRQLQEKVNVIEGLPRGTIMVSMLWGAPGKNYSAIIVNRHEGELMTRCTAHGFHDKISNYMLASGLVECYFPGEKGQRGRERSYLLEKFSTGEKILPDWKTKVQ